MNGQKNQKKIVFFIIIIITLVLFYGVRKNEEYNEKLNENKKVESLSFNKLLKSQIEDDIHLNNSKILNIKIEVDDLKKIILKNQMEKEKEESNNNKKNNEEIKNELWMIETIFLTIFCIILGGLYFYAYKKENENNYKVIKKNYLNDKDYYLAESEMEYLINKGELDNYYNKLNDEQKEYN